jgi:hypothetical protein
MKKVRENLWCKSHILSKTSAKTHCIWCLLTSYDMPSKAISIKY